MEESQEVKYLIETVDDVLNAFNSFFNVPDTESTIEDLYEYMGQVRATVLSMGQAQIKWAIFYLGVGRSIMNSLPSDFNKKKFAKFLLEKHKRYGIQPLLNWQHLGILVRIDAKMTRYANQVEQGMKDDEDQIVDILGYCVLGLYLDKFLRASAERIQIVTGTPPLPVEGPGGFH